MFNGYEHNTSEEEVVAASHTHNNLKENISHPESLDMVTFGTQTIWNRRQKANKGWLFNHIKELSKMKTYCTKCLLGWTSKE